MSTWWLSFASEQRFLGAAIVDGVDLVEAVKNAHRVRANPGGEVLGGAIDPERVAQIPMRFRDRTLSRDEIDELDVIMGSDGRLTSEEKKAAVADGSLEFIREPERPS